MAIVIKPITVEVSRPNVFQAIAAKQNDSNSRFLKVTFVNEGKIIEVIPSAKVTINAERNDGQSNSFFGEVNDDGTVTVPIHSWILELPGYVNCDISIIEEDSKLTSTTFTLLVEEASHVSDDISSDPQYDVLMSLIKKVEALEPGNIDQKYDPTSKNAQSGIAIAGALSSNAITTTAYANKQVELTGILPTEHEVRVQLHSRNVLPTARLLKTQTQNGVTANVYADGMVILNGTCTATTCFSYYFTCERTGRYCIRDFASGTWDGNSEHPRLEIWNSTQKVGYKTYQTDYGSKCVSFMLNEGDRIKVGIWVFKGSEHSSNVLRPAMYYGVDSITDWYSRIYDFRDVNLRVIIEDGGDLIEIDELYANENGVVEGIKSVPLSSVMILKSSWYSVDVEATYLIDTKTYIDKKFDELALML